MALEFQGSGQAFELSDWRQSIQARRELVRAIIVRSAVEGEPLKRVLSDFKRAISFYRLPDRDKNLLNVMMHDIRTIAGKWHNLPSRDRDLFVAGKIVPSTLAKQARLTEA